MTETSRGTSVELPSHGKNKAIRLTPVGKSALKPKSLRLAVNACCWQCQGEDHDPGVVERIRNCEIPSCALHKVRPYQEDG